VTLKADRRMSAGVVTEDLAARCEAAYGPTDHGQHVPQSPVTLGERLRPRKARGLLARSRTSAPVFADFYEEMAPSVLQFFAKNVADPQRAVDLMAETFAKAFEKRQSFRGETDLEAAAWLWAIARNELVSFLRTRRVELVAMSRLQLERPSPSDEELSEIEALTAVTQAQACVEQALGTLPADQRDVIRMRFAEHLGYSEIAERLGVSNDVVRARYSRALRTLRTNEQVHEALQALEA
jgi:RNA polymerase sigma factor (sigma-70 family)